MTQISENPRKNREIYENRWKTYIGAKVSIGAAGCSLGCFNIMTQISENLQKNNEIYENRRKNQISENHQKNYAIYENLLKHLHSSNGCYRGSKLPLRVLQHYEPNLWKSMKKPWNLWKSLKNHIRAKVSIGAAGCLLWCFDIMSKSRKIIKKTMKSMKIYEKPTFE